jgi:flagellar basal-body rod protein FlgB
MWLDKILASRTTRAVELTASFTEQRHRVLAENLANIDTPDYQTKVLPAEKFEAALKTALERSQGDGLQRVQIKGDKQFTTTPAGHLRATPALEPVHNALFHDGTNARMERLMTAVTENSLRHSMALKLLGRSYGRLLAAIKGNPQ